MSEVEEKSKLREMLLKKRRGLSNRETEACVNTIKERFIINVSFNKVNTIHIYRSMVDKKEVDTSILIDWIRTNHPEIEIIFAPSKKPFYLPKNESYDLIIVPVLGFDRSGNRLGYGGGYYDRLLSLNNCKKTIGLAYSFCEVDKLPAEAHDQKLDIIITEKEIIDR